MESPYAIPAPFLASCLFVLLMGSIEIGVRVAARPDGKAEGRTSSPLTTATGAVLALVGLLLAFSFAMASARYDARRLLVVKEANAISAAYLRADLLDGPASLAVKNLLRRYVDVRLEADPERLDESQLYDLEVNETVKLQQQIWAAAAEPGPRPPTPSLVLPALNAVFEVACERLAARRSHVPNLVLYLLLFSINVAGFLLAHTLESSGRRRWPIAIAFALVMSLVFYTILDFDRPYRGMVTVSQEPLELLRDRLKA